MRDTNSAHDGDRCEDTEVAAKPREVLVNNRKSIADCTELHLGRRGITHLTDDMKSFKNLEVLWLNDNSLLAITSLDFNPGIKSLYAHNNRIETLKGSLTGFTFLHTLTIGNNRIGNLQISLGVLKQMRHLKYLELTGNPLVEETGYRLLVIKTLPWLEILDMHKVTNEEQRAARHARVPQSWKAPSSGHGHGRSEGGVGLTQDLAAKETMTESWEEGRRGSTTNVPLSIESPCQRRTTRAMLHNELSRIRDVVKNRRILLIEWFKAEDPRRENVVNQALFIRCLEHHGLWPPGPAGDTNSLCSSSIRRGVFQDEGTTISTTPPTATTFSGETGLLAGILLEAFRVPRPPRRAATLGRDPTYLRQTFIDYVKFCGAVELKHGGRDPQSQEEGDKELHKEWEAKPFVRKKRYEEGPRSSQRLKHAEAGENGNADGCDRIGEEISDEHFVPVLSTKAPIIVASDAYDFKESRNAGGGAVDGLDHWERIELKRVFETQGGSGTPGEGATAAATPTTTPQMITRAQALLGLKAMELRGRRPRIFDLAPPASTDEDSFNQLSGRSAAGDGGQHSSNASAGIKGKDSQATATSVTNFDVLFDAAVIESLTTKGSINAAARGKNINNGRSDGNGRDDSRRVVADIAVLVRTLEKGVSGAGGVGPLEWGWLSRAEAEERSKRLYRQASHAQRRLLLMSDNGDDDIALQQEAARIRDNIAALTRNAARLETLAAAAAAAATQHADLEADASRAAENRRTLLIKGGKKYPPSNNRLLPLSTPPGRVDFFVSTEYHGHPFESPEYDRTGITTKKHRRIASPLPATLASAVPRIWRNDCRGWAPQEDASRMMIAFLLLRGRATRVDSQEKDRGSRGQS